MAYDMLMVRLEEFEVTDASNLTAEQFAQGAEEAIAREADPPSFARNRREEAAEKAAVAPEIDDDGVYTCARCHISENVGDDMNAVLQGQVSKNDLERMTARLTPGDVPKDKEAPAQPGSSPAQPPETQPQDSQSKEKRPKTPKKFKYIDAEPDPEFDGEYQDDEIDDAEIDAMLVSPEEMEAKSQVWNELNKDYLDKIKQMETDGIERKPRQRKVWIPCDVIHCVRRRSAALVSQRTLHLLLLTLRHVSLKRKSYPIRSIMLLLRMSWVVVM